MYTDLRLVLEALGGRQREFHWLITDLEWILLGPSHDGDGLPTYEGPLWISGEDLTDLVSRFDIQWIWAVLSGFRRASGADIGVDMEVEPLADGNDRLWTSGPSIQHPGADVEIVCWDSSSVLFLSRDHDLTKRFRTFFPEAVDLEGFNRATGTRR
ncbi:MAG: hypothetical protein R3246_15220 [Acidimicrobiia bacterium]|nr:hypothetical protein [Acidimicrobiia bacterium]